MRRSITKLCKFSFTILLLVGLGFFAQAQSVTLAKKIVASDRDKDDWFSYSMDVSGDYAISGAFQEKHNLTGGAELKDAGAVYILEKENGVWLQKQKLVASDRAINNRFGYSVSISGNTAAVSATGASNGGAVYIFERDNNGVWTQKQKIPGLVATGYTFGVKISLRGNRLMIGDSHNKTNASGGASIDNAGAIFVFEKQANGTFTQQQKIVSTDRADGLAYSYFGETFDFDGDFLVVGKEKETKDLVGANNMNYGGAVYVFERAVNGTWSQKVKLIAADRKAMLYFGRQVAIKGNTLVVGAIGGDPVGVDTHYAGSAYIYQREANGAWIFKDKIFANDREGEDNFGDAVAIEGDYIAVGAPDEGEPATGGFPFGGQAKQYGAVYFFAKDGAGKWIQQQKLVATTRTEYQMFGYRVVLSGNELWAGCFRDDTDANGQNSKTLAGSIYVYDIIKPLDHTNAFITTWDTDKLSNGSVSFNTYGNQYEYYWEKIGEEANTNSGTYLIGVNSSGQSLVIPQMAKGTGAYRLYIKKGSGTFTGFMTYGHAGSAKALTAVESWGNIGWTNLMGAFLAAENLTSLPGDAPNLSQVTDLSLMFAGAASFNQNITGWNVSGITNMSRMFSGASSFNQNLGSWTLKSGVDLTTMLDNSGLNSNNYGLTLKGWAENANTPANLTLGALGLRYKEETQQYHDILTTQKNWIINDGGVLPVTILGFVAKLNGNQTNLRWQTSSEQNNKMFVVSRSADGKSFTELTRIAGAGNSFTLKSYTYNDHSPLNGVNYYKLEQIDIDGEINFIGVEVVSFKLSTPSVTVYPNPTAGEINVVIPSEFGKTVTVNIVDMSGKTVYTEKLQLNQSQLSYKLNNQAIASGQYIVKIVGEAKAESLKVLVK